MEPYTLPIVLTIAGNDPTGGAGLSADVEAIISQGCHALPVLSCITVQDTCDVLAVETVHPDLLIQQARTVLEDLPVDVIKIGLLSSEENVEAVHELLVDYADIPVVLDPIISAGGGNLLCDEGAVEAMKDLLFPYTTILTPNSEEARLLVPGSDNAQSAIPSLLEMGCKWVLLTGTHENTSEVINRLYSSDGEHEQFNWPRLEHTYHGSGCTLSSAIAGLLAQGLDMNEAVAQAQDYTWHALQNGYRLGMGQRHPNRLFWAEQSLQENEGNQNS
ncbi:MAG: hydroxymethylpyrimidine/phosphomethylpyrimidine kinase [Gammaproteobacteria bacterium]|nr:hydroxymethylpyrimidine/phosphomethylpyrimidine kinase [Gammaproteobacteria bacterium]